MQRVVLQQSSDHKLVLCLKLLKAFGTQNKTQQVRCQTGKRFQPSVDLRHKLLPWFKGFHKGLLVSS
jgi:hypothetical protein